MTNKSGVMKGVILSWVVLMIGCGGQEFDPQSGSGKAEVLDEEMARSLVPLVWTYYIRSEKNRGMIKAESPHGNVYLYIYDDGSAAIDAYGPGSTPLQRRDKQLLILNFYNDMKEQMLSEEVFQEKLDQLDEGLEDGYHRPTFEWLMNEGLPVFYSLTSAALTNICIGYLAAEGIIAVAAPELLIGSAVVIMGGYLSLLAHEIFGLDDGWLKLGSCYNASCHLALLEGPMM